MENTDITYTYNSDGYMLYYKDKPIGGAGVKPHWVTRRAWQAVRADLEDNREYARMEKNNILAGKGQKRFMDVIARIDADLTN